MIEQIKPGSSQRAKPNTKATHQRLALVTAAKAVKTAKQSVASNEGKRAIGTPLHQKLAKLKKYAVQLKEQEDATVRSSVLSCDSKLDLGFAIDGCGTQSFSKCTDLVKSIIKNVNVSPDDTHVGVIVYSRRARLLFGFKDLTNTSQIYDALDNIKYKLTQHRDSLNIGAALEVARRDLFSKGRSGVPRVLVVVTGGKASDDIVIPARRLKYDGITVYSVGVGKSFDKGQLDVISSDTAYNYTFKSDEQSVAALSHSVRSEVCKGSADTALVVDASNNVSPKDIELSTLAAHDNGRVPWAVNSPDYNDDESNFKGYEPLLIPINGDAVVDDWSNEDTAVDSWANVLKEAASKETDRHIHHALHQQHDQQSDNETEGTVSANSGEVIQPPDKPKVETIGRLPGQSAAGNSLSNTNGPATTAGSNGTPTSQASNPSGLSVPAASTSSGAAVGQTTPNGNTASSASNPSQQSGTSSSPVTGLTGSLLVPSTNQTVSPGVSQGNPASQPASAAPASAGSQAPVNSGGSPGTGAGSMAGPSNAKVASGGTPSGTQSGIPVINPQVATSPIQILPVPIAVPIPAPANSSPSGQSLTSAQQPQTPTAQTQQLPSHPSSQAQQHKQSKQQPPPATQQQQQQQQQQQNQKLLPPPPPSVPQTPAAVPQQQPFSPSSPPPSPVPVPPAPEQPQQPSSPPLVPVQAPSVSPQPSSAPVQSPSSPQQPKSPALPSSSSSSPSPASQPLSASSTASLPPGSPLPQPPQPVVGQPQKGKPQEESGESADPQGQTISVVIRPQQTQVIKPPATPPPPPTSNGTLPTTKPTVINKRPPAIQNKTSPVSPAKSNNTTPKTENTTSPVPPKGSNATKAKAPPPKGQNAPKVTASEGNGVTVSAGPFPGLQIEPEMLPQMISEAGSQPFAPNAAVNEKMEGKQPLLIGQCQDFHPSCPLYAFSSLCDEAPESQSSTIREMCMLSCGVCSRFAKIGNKVNYDLRHGRRKKQSSGGRKMNGMPEYNPKFW